MAKLCFLEEEQNNSRITIKREWYSEVWYLQRIIQLFSNLFSYMDTIMEAAKIVKQE